MVPNHRDKENLSGQRTCNLIWWCLTEIPDSGSDLLEEEKTSVEGPVRRRQPCSPAAAGTSWALEMMNSLPSTLKKRGRQVLPTLPLLSQEDVSSIWGKVSEFVERQLLMNKKTQFESPLTGVIHQIQIPGLGIFTFTRQRLQVGNNKFIFLKRPVFVLAEKLVQLHRLEQNKIYTPGNIPVIPLNFNMLSVDLPFTRDIVEGCVRETLLFLSCTISTEQSVEFTFKGIGVLVIRESKVKMRFYKDFLSTVDGSGNLVKALTNRPGTVDSVLSSTEALKKHPSSTIAFPREQEFIVDTVCSQQVFVFGLKNRMARRQNQKNAYNLSVAEAVRKHKNGKPEFYESYIFPNRPLTAEVNARKQEEYSQSLLKQIDDQRKQEMKQRENEELLEHLERVQLAEEVATQKFKSWQEKAEESRRYKRALDAQIKNKPYQLPVLEPDSSAPIFGRNDDRTKMSTLEAPDNLLLDQCASVNQCKQCQRDTSNRGKSNLCPVNKHMPASGMFM
ncbi:coiled-coil domain-containing protein 81-like [Rhynchocyon petersi]